MTTDYGTMARGAKSLEAEVRDQRSEIGSQKSEVRGQPPTREAMASQGGRRAEGNLDCAVVSGGDLVWLNGRTPNSKS